MELHEHPQSSIETKDENFQNTEQSAKYSIEEIRDFTKEYSPWARKNLADQIKYARKLAFLKTDTKEDSQINIKDLQQVFFERFSKQKEDFEKTILETNIDTVSQKYGVIFVHTFPIKGMNRWNTSMNNEAVDPQNLSPEELISMIQTQKPDLSCSSVSLDERISSQPDETMYPFGIVLGEGNILSAYRYDGGTLTEKAVQHKKSKYDPHTKDTSIQTDIVEKIDTVLTRKFDRYQNPENGYYDIHKDYKTGEISAAEYPESKDYLGYSTSDAHVYDEFVVSNPRIDGLYVNLDDGRLKGEWNSGFLDQVNSFVQRYPNVPVYIKQKGKLQIFSYDTEGNPRLITNEADLKKLHSLGLNL